MPKETSATEYRKKNNTELLADLKKLREELQTIRFTKVTGTAVSKLSKIKGLRKQIARILTIIRENKKQEVISKLLTKETKEVVDGKETSVSKTIKNLKMKHLPLDLRPKKTRAIRRKMTKFESKLLTLKLFKRKLSCTAHIIALPVSSSEGAFTPIFLHVYTINIYFV